jgi:hypothetical protein
MSSTSLSTIYYIVDSLCFSNTPQPYACSVDEEQLEEQEGPDNTEHPKEQEVDKEDRLVGGLENGDDDEPTESVQVTDDQ